MRKLRIRLASSIASAVNVKIELDYVVVNEKYSTSNPINNPSIIDLDVPDSGSHQLTFTFLNDSTLLDGDLNLIIGRCQLSNTNNEFVLGSYLANDPSNNFDNGIVTTLFFRDESFTLNIDCDNPITWFDYNSGSDGTLIETQALSITGRTAMLDVGDNIADRCKYTAVNTPVTASISPAPAPTSWFSFNDLQFGGIVPAGTDETYTVTITDSTGASVSADYRFKIFIPA
jgi:hypothetical protein